MAGDAVRTKVDRELYGGPITVGSRTIQPVARVKGWTVSGSADNGAADGGVLRVDPTEVIVREADGRTHRVTIICREDRTARYMALAGLAIAIGCLLLILFTGRTHRRENRD